MRGNTSMVSLEPHIEGTAYFDEPAYLVSAGHHLSETRDCIGHPIPGADECSTRPRNRPHGVNEQHELLHFALRSVQKRIGLYDTLSCYLLLGQPNREPILQTLFISLPRLQRHFGQRHSILCSLPARRDFSEQGQGGAARLKLGPL